MSANKTKVKCKMLNCQTFIPDHIIFCKTHLNALQTSKDKYRRELAKIFPNMPEPYMVRDILYNCFPNCNGCDSHNPIFLPYILSHQSVNNSIIYINNNGRAIYDNYPIKYHLEYVSEHIQSPITITYYDIPFGILFPDLIKLDDRTQDTALRQVPITIRPYKSNTVRTIYYQIMETIIRNRFVSRKYDRLYDYYMFGILYNAMKSVNIQNEDFAYIFRKIVGTEALYNKNHLTYRHLEVVCAAIWMTCSTYRQSIELPYKISTEMFIRTDDPEYTKLFSVSNIRSHIRLTGCSLEYGRQKVLNSIVGSALHHQADFKHYMVIDNICAGSNQYRRLGIDHSISVKIFDEEPTVQIKDTGHSLYLYSEGFTLCKFDMTELRSITEWYTELVLMHDPIPELKGSIITPFTVSCHENTAFIFCDRQIYLDLTYEESYHSLSKMMVVN